VKKGLPHEEKGGVGGETVCPGGGGEEESIWCLDSLTHPEGGEYIQSWSGKSFLELYLLLTGGRKKPDRRGNGAKS